MGLRGRGGRWVCRDAGWLSGRRVAGVFGSFGFFFCFSLLLGTVFDIYVYLVPFGGVGG